MRLMSFIFLAVKSRGRLFNRDRRGTGTRAAAAKLLFLPAYLPDLNPTVQVLAKVKDFLFSPDARPVEVTRKVIGEFLSAFTAEECAYYLTNTGTLQRKRILL